MAIQLGILLRNNMLDQIENTAGVSARLQLRTGAQPADCSVANSGVLLVEIVLPFNWMLDAVSGTKSKLDLWAGTAIASGTAAHFRIFDSADTICHLQGTVTSSGSGGDLTLNNPVISSAQIITINTFTLTGGNA